MEPRQLRASIDGAITRYLFAQQRNFAAEANGSALSRWATPFSMDVAFGPDGTAVVYDTHLVPTWKRAGHWGHAAIDRANNLGVYSAMMLGMAPLLFDSAAADAHHRAALGDRLGAGRKLAETAGAKESDLSARALLDFARDQAAAHVLGMRRAWPSTDARAVDAATRLGEQRDVGYARALQSLGLLAREMDAMEQLDASTLHDVFDESPPRWPFEGALWLARNATRVICDDAPAIIASWADAL